MSEITQTFQIDTEVAPSQVKVLLGIIRQFYTHAYGLNKPWYFTNIEERTADHGHILSITLHEPNRGWYITMEAMAQKPIGLRITYNDQAIPSLILERLREDLIIAVQMAEEEIRKRTLYFAWVRGKEMALERVLTQRRRDINKLFSSNMLMIYVIFIGLSILLFGIFGPYAPIIMISLQFVFLLLSDRIIMRMGEWTITEENPRIYLLQYHIPTENYLEFMQRHGNELLKIKREIYERTLAVGEEIDCPSAEAVFLKYGVQCDPDSMSTKVVDVYRLVKSAAERFGLKIPKITVSNTMLPNAAASGPSPSHGVVLITTGLLVQLDDDEALAVIGHEMSHLNGRDPLVLFGMTALEYLLRVYFLWRLPIIGPIIIFFPYFYFMLAMGVIYFIAKFFEARADLESAIKMGQPKVLAEALRKIGFRRLPFERMPSYKLQSWMVWDPHPPISFRIERLEKLETPSEEKHPLIRSAKDVIDGFRKAMKR